MTRFVTIPPLVVPLAYSGLELEVWRLAEELDRAFETREENHGWFEVPLDGLGRTRELLRVIDSPKDDTPTEVTVEIDTWHDLLLAGLQAELRMRRNHRDDKESGPELREEARRAIAIIDSFLEALPGIEAQAEPAGPKSGVPYTDPDGIEHAIVFQVLRCDREHWSRRDLERELYDVEPKAVGDALKRLHEAGVIHLDGEQIRAADPARHLDDLGMLSI